MTARIPARWWAAAAMVLAVFAVTLDVTVLTVALPTLAGALKASESQLQWFVNAYTLALVGGMLPAGLLGDRFGRRRMMVAALLLFSVGSIGCAYSTGPELFIVARAVLGIAGAILIVMVLSNLTVLFEEKERPRAIGIWSAANFVGLPLGPIVGGWLLSHTWWGWIFLMNVPVALIALGVVLVLVPESRAQRAPGIDIVGVVLSSAGLVALMYGIVEAGDNGWGATSAVVPAIAGLAVIGAFGLWEQWLKKSGWTEPLVDLSVFRSRAFTWGILCTAFGVFGLFGVLFALPQYYQAVMNLDPEGSGIRLLPTVVGLMVGALPADRVASRIGVKLTVAIGFAIVVAGSAIGSTMTVSSNDSFLATWTFVVGAGGGLGFATAASAALVELSADRAGVGSALLQAIVKLGPAFGASILGSVLNSTYQHQVNVAGLPGAVAETVRSSVFAGLAVGQKIDSPALVDSVRSAFVAGMDNALLVAVGVSVFAIVLALAFLPGRVRSVDARQVADTGRASTSQQA